MINTNKSCIHLQVLPICIKSWYLILSFLFIQPFFHLSFSLMIFSKFICLGASVATKATAKRKGLFGPVVPEGSECVLVTRYSSTQAYQSEQEPESSHPHLQVQTRESPRKPRRRQGRSGTSQSPPTVMEFPSKTSLLPQTASSNGDQMFKQLRPREEKKKSYTFHITSAAGNNPLGKLKKIY